MFDKYIHIIGEQKRNLTCPGLVDAVCVVVLFVCLGFFFEDGSDNHVQWFSLGL